MAPIKKIVVYHNQNPHGQGYTEFSGDRVEHQCTDDGGLLIRNWQTGSFRGNARFAPGQWVYMLESKPDTPDPQTPETDA